MYIFLLFPLVEIIGFVTIGGDIGLGGTLLWLFLSAWGGMVLLKKFGHHVMQPPQNEEDFFKNAEVFDPLCQLAAGLLLIFPGFISDFIAIPFLVPVFRNFIRNHFRAHPSSTATTIILRGQRFADQRFRATKTTTTVIDGEYKTLRDDKPRE